MSSALCSLTKALKDDMRSLQKIEIIKESLSVLFLYFRPRTKDDLRAYFVLVQVMALFLHTCMFFLFCFLLMMKLLVLSIS